MEIIKLGILYFSLFTWYQSQRENLILFSSDRVSFRSSSPPPDFLLAAADRRRRLSGKLFSGRKPQISKRRGPIYTPVATPPETGITRSVTRGSSPAACRPRAGACGRVAPSPVMGLHSQGRPAPSWCSSPPAVHSEHSFSTF